MKNQSSEESGHILPTPGKAPFPIDKFLELTPAERVARSMVGCKDASPSPCVVPVRVGLFFDGTNNNIYRDRDGEQIIGIGDAATVSGGKEPLQLFNRSHSNVARLYEAFPVSDEHKGIFSYYIPGVGTRFKEIEEYNETSDGKAFAKGGQARIIFALLQVLNSVNFVLTQSRLFSNVEAGKAAKRYEKFSAKNDDANAESADPHVEFFADYIAALEKALKENPKPVIPSVTVDVFGFSRGGAEAVAFCHLFDKLLNAGKLASIPAQVNFLGVFDVVASVGVSFSVKLTMPVLELSADGHFDWAKHILKPLPASVRSGRHFIAAHEQRMNFPVTTQIGSSSFKQVYFPGVHSDVGGGYGPGEGGKARGGQSELLSQIPLAYMYKEARIEGVPFKDFKDLEEVFKADFEISASLAQAWEAYCDALHVNGENHGDRVRTHMSLYYRWRKSRSTSLEKTAFYLASNKQAKQDYAEANEILNGDVEVLRARDALPQFPDPEMQVSTFGQNTRVSQWQALRRKDRLTDWEKWALSVFDKGAELPEAVVKFFDDYVHDSLAGFYLAGEVTEYDKQEMVKKVLNKKPSNLSGFEKKIYEHAKAVEEAVLKAKQNKPLSDQEKNLVEEHESGLVYPVMTDKDVKSMRSFVIATQTSSRREGGGYFLPRFYFPRHWRGLHKEFIDQKMLDREARLMRGNQPDAPDKLEGAA